MGGAGGAGGVSAAGDPYWFDGDFGSGGACASTPGFAGPKLGLVSAQLTPSGMKLSDGPTFETADNPFVRALASTSTGALVGSKGGFWDVESGAAPRWVEAPDDGVVRGFFVGDLDGDGTQDVVVESEVDVTVMLSGMSLATFDARYAAWQRIADGYQRGYAIEVSDIHGAFALGDLNHDGSADLVTVESGTPVAYLSDGAFGFDRGTGPPLPVEDRLRNSGQFGAGIYDADGDGDLDLVAAYAGYQAGVSELFVALHPGDGHGGFGPPRVSVVREDWDESAAFGGFGDVTADGVADLVLTMQDESGYDVYVAPGLGEGRFDRAEFVFASPNATEAWAYDADGDGLYDIALTYQDDAGHLQFVILNAQSGLDFETQRHVLPVGRYRGMEPRADGKLDVLLELGCGPVCTAACPGRCLLGLCFTCVDDTDCPSAVCRAGACVAPLDDVDAGDADAG